jgi:hypothetical protein
MKMLMARIFGAIAALWLVVAVTPAQADCGGVFGANKVCGTASTPDFAGAVDRGFVFATDYGASTAASAATNRAAIQAAIDATPVGGIAVLIGATFATDAAIYVNKTMTLLCGGGSRGSPNIRMQSLSENIIVLSATSARAIGCAIDRVTTGTPTGDGFVIGDIRKLTADCSITIGLTLVTCASAPFVPGDVGKGFSLEGAGSTGNYLFSSIASYVSATQINVATPASSSQSSKTAYFGVPPFDVRIDDFIALNSVHQVRVEDGQKWIITRGFALGPNGALIQNVLAADAGEGNVDNVTFFPTDNTNGYGIKWTSSGGLRLANVKVTGGKYGIFQNWTFGASGGMFATNVAVENCETAGFYSLNTVLLTRTAIEGFSVGCSGSAVQAVSIDPASTVAMTELAISNLTYVGSNASTPIIDLNDVERVTLSNNVIYNSGVGTCLSIATTVNGIRIGSDNYFGCATETTGGSPTDMRFGPQIHGFGMGANGLVYGFGGNSRQIAATTAATDGQLIVGQTSNPPLPKTISGDVTFSAAGAATIANDAVTNAKLANMANATTKCRTTAGTGDPEDCTAAQVAAFLSAPTYTVYTSGSGTHTTASNAKALEIELVGGGGGGAGSGTTPGAAGAGGNTTFSTLAGNGGGAGLANGGSCSGGTASNGYLNLPGAVSQTATGSANSFGGMGANSPFGGGGAGGVQGSAGKDALANTGSGGGGAGDGATVNSGGGGCSGGYVKAILTSPSASYSYAVGAAGTAGTAGTSGAAGGAGAAGIIIVKTIFQ